MTPEDIVELADAVAIYNGVATGIGQEAYGAQLVVNADTADEAEILAKKTFRQAAAAAGLPEWPIVEVDALSEEQDAEPDYY